MAAKSKITNSVVEAINAHASGYLTGLMGADSHGGSIAAELHRFQNPTWTTYKSWRDAFMACRPETMTVVACERAWSRLVKNAGVTIPKATGVDAVIKAAQRSKAKDEMAKIDDESLTKRITALKDAGFAESSAPIKKLNAELKRRIAKAEEPQKALADTTRKAIIEKVKSMTYAELSRLAKDLKLSIVESKPLVKTK